MLTFNFNFLQWTKIDFAKSKMLSDLLLSQLPGLSIEISEAVLQPCFCSPYEHNLPDEFQLLFSAKGRENPELGSVIKEQGSILHPLLTLEILPPLPDDFSTPFLRTDDSSAPGQGTGNKAKAHLITHLLVSNQSTDHNLNIHFN